MRFYMFIGNVDAEVIDFCPSVYDNTNYKNVSLVNHLIIGLIYLCP